MRALVAYESMYGNTHVIAGNIADGLREKRHGNRLVAAPQGFLACSHNNLVDGEGPVEPGGGVFAGMLVALSGHTHCR